MKRIAFGSWWSLWNHLQEILQWVVYKVDTVEDKCDPDLSYHKKSQTKLQSIYRAWFLTELNQLGECARWLFVKTQHVLKNPLARSILNLLLPSHVINLVHLKIPILFLTLYVGRDRILCEKHRIRFYPGHLGKNRWTSTMAPSGLDSLN